MSSLERPFVVLKSLLALLSFFLGGFIKLILLFLVVEYYQKLLLFLKH